MDKPISPSLLYTTLHTDNREYHNVLSPTNLSQLKFPKKHVILGRNSLINPKLPNRFSTLTNCINVYGASSKLFFNMIQSPTNITKNNNKTTITPYLPEKKKPAKHSRKLISLRENRYKLNAYQNLSAFFKDTKGRNGNTLTSQERMKKQNMSYTFFNGSKRSIEETSLIKDCFDKINNTSQFKRIVKKALNYNKPQSNRKSHSLAIRNKCDDTHCKKISTKPINDEIDGRWEYKENPDEEFSYGTLAVQ